jgi:hypothetical protein
MFGEEISESPRQPSPWQDMAPTTNWVRRPSSSAAERKAIDSLRLAAAESQISLKPESDETGHVRSLRMGREG